MRSAAFLLALALAACSRGVASEPAAPQPQQPPHLRRQQVPDRAKLPCFGCHSYEQFQNGPGFPHEGGGGAHREVGHCSVCHASAGHHGTAMDWRVCLNCHEQADIKGWFERATFPGEAAPEAPK